MTAVDNDALSFRVADEAPEKGGIPQINLEHDSVDSSHLGAEESTALEPPVVESREPRFVSLDGEVNGNSHNQTSVEYGSAHSPQSSDSSTANMTLKCGPCRMSWR